MSEQEASLNRPPQTPPTETGRVATVLTCKTNLSPREAMMMAARLRMMIAMELGIDPARIHPHVREPHHPVPYKEIT